MLLLPLCCPLLLLLPVVDCWCQALLRFIVTQVLLFCLVSWLGFFCQFWRLNRLVLSQQGHPSRPYSINRCSLHPQQNNKTKTPLHSVAVLSVVLFRQYFFLFSLVCLLLVLLCCVVLFVGEFCFDCFVLCVCVFSSGHNGLVLSSLSFVVVVGGISQIHQQCNTQYTNNASSASLPKSETSASIRCVDFSWISDIFSAPNA